MFRKYFWYKATLIFITFLLGGNTVFAQPKKPLSTVRPATKAARAKRLPVNSRISSLTTTTPVPPLSRRVKEGIILAKPLPVKWQISIPNRVFTMEQLLAIHYPDWKNSAFKKLTPEQIEIVQQAITRTDNAFFSTDSRGKTIHRKSDDKIWNYEEEFIRQLENVLKENNSVLIPGHMNFILKGGYGHISFPFHHYLKTTSLELFILVNNTVPSINAANLAEAQLGIWISHVRHGSGTEAIQSLVNTLFEKYRKRSSASLLTHKQFYEEIIKFIETNGYFPSVADPIPYGQVLANDFENRKRDHADDSYIQQTIILKKNTLSWQKFKIAQSNQNLYERYKQFVEDNGYLPNRPSEDPEEEQLAAAYSARKQNYSQDPYIQLISEMQANTPVKRQFKQEQDNKQFYEQFEQFITFHGYYPDRRSSDPTEQELYRQYMLRSRKYRWDPSIQQAIILMEETPSRHQLALAQDNKMFYDRVKTFVQENGYLPNLHLPDYPHKSFTFEYNRRKKHYPQDPSVQQLVALVETTPSYEQFRVEQNNKKLHEQIANFVKEKGYFPSRQAPSKVEQTLATRYKKCKELYPQDPSVIQMNTLRRRSFILLRKNPSLKLLNNQEFYEELESFVKEKGYFPRSSAILRHEQDLYKEYHRRKRLYSKDPFIIQAKELRETTPSYKQYRAMQKESTAP